MRSEERMSLWDNAQCTIFRRLLFARLRMWSILLWVSGIVLFSVPALFSQTITVNISAYMQGLWNGTTHVPVPVSIELRSGSQLPNSALVARKAAMLTTSATASVTFEGISSGNYWIVLRCAGYIPVASSTATLINPGDSITWDFTAPANVWNGSAALISVGSYFLLRAADLNVDRSVNITDLLNLLGNNGLNNPGQVPAP